MSSCDGSSINKNYIVLPPTDVDILSACTGFYTNNIYNCTGDTLTLHSTTVSANTINASVYLSGGTNLLDIFGSFVDNNTFVTGYTYDDANTFTISDNSGSTFNATFNTVTGLTVNGGLSATTVSACTGIYTSNLYGCSPITVNDSLILLSGLTFSSITEDNTLTQILGRNSTTGDIEYRDVQSIISASTSQDTFVTGFTYDDVNTFTIGDNSGSTFNASINVLSATTISATTYFGDGSNLTGIPHTTDTFVSGGTYNTGTKNINFSGNSVDTTFDVDLTSLISSVSGDTFVTGFTYNDNNTFTINDNAGSAFTATINQVSGLTVNGTLSATTLDGNTILSGGTNLLTIIEDLDTYVTGGTYSDITDVITFTNTNGVPFNVTGVTDTFVTGFTWDTSTFDLTIKQNNGITDETVNLSILSSDVYVLSGVYSASTGVVTYTNSTGGTFQVSGFTTGMTDSYTVSANLNSESIEFVNNLQTPNPFYSVSLTPLLSGKTNNTTFNTYTSDTQTIINTKISGATNLIETGIFGQKNGENLEFKGITSTGGTVTITNDSTSVNIEIPIDTNTFVTGFTYDNSNNLTISRNDGSGFTTNIGTMTGLTVNGTLSATTLDGGTILSGGTNLTTIIESFDTYVTGGTVSISATTNTNSATIGLLYKNSEGVPHTLPFDDTFTTGATYDNVTELVTFDKNDGTSYFLNLSTIDVNDTFVTGGTYSSGTTSLDFSGNTGFVPFSVNVSELIDDTNTFVTGSTLSGNTLVLTRNDAVELSTDLSSIVPDSNLGNILFVATTGDDSTGTKGDIHKPYRNLYAAKSASTSGDTVYVFPGTWEYDNRTSAGNPYNGQVDTLVNLWKDGVTYYFVPDTKIIFYNQTVGGESMYLFNPGGTTGETCNVLGGLEYEQFSNGADTSNGANYFYFNDSGFDSTFYSETHKLTSHHCQVISLELNDSDYSASTTNITLKTEYEYRDYLSGQTSAGSQYYIGDNYGVVNFVASSKYRDYRNAAYGFYFNLSNANSTVHIYGETLKSESQIFLLRGSGDGNVATYNVGISDIYYGNGYTPFGYYGAVLSTYSKGGWTLNMNSNLYDLDPNSLTTGLFVTSNLGGSSDNNTINFKGNITTNTSSGVGRYIVDESSSGNTINIDGDITYLGSGTTTKMLFQANGSDSVINYSGKISGNFASGIAIPKNGGLININNSYIDSTVDGNTSSVFQNDTTVLGTGRLNNSYVRLTNNTNGVVDGEDNDIYINNSTIINLGTGSTVVYNTTDNGNLQIVNSVLISSYSGATSINYTGNTSVISSNTTVNTDYSASTINGNIITLTDLIY